MLVLPAHRCPRPFRRAPSPPFATALIGALGCLAAPAHAQWTAVVLHPPAAYTSDCLRGQDGTQVGMVDDGSAPTAALWHDTAASYTNLHPTGALYSRIFGVDGQRQVGYSYPASVAHAAMWTGTAASHVDLNPSGASTSTAFDVAGDTIVGQAKFNTLMQAGIWNATTNGWTSLHPTTAPPSTWSNIAATDGLQQAGEAVVGGHSHAMLWSGSAGSAIDLHSYTATDTSATDVHTGQQVGRATFNFVNHACMWSGSAASFVDLQPAGATRSEANGVHLGVQVGFAQIAGYYHAGLWHGSAASWQDLHGYLPPTFTSSIAFGIWHDIYGVTYVVGTGNESGHQHAVMWILVPPIWTDLGFAKAGISGLPLLSGVGPLTTNSLTSLTLTNANPSTTAVLVMGVLPANVPFLGGVLVPDPVILVPLTTDATGVVTWQVNLPSLPTGLPLRFQHWIDDPTVSYGWSASNGLLGICQ